MTGKPTAKKEDVNPVRSDSEDKPTCVVMPNSLRADLKFYATNNNTSMSNVVQDACVAFLKSTKKD